jgi:lysophospholipase L1-like esterase
LSGFKRRIVFRIVAVAIGLSPLVALELGLRLAGVAAPTSRTEDAERPLSAMDADPLVDLHSLRPLFTPSEDGASMRIASERMNYFCPAEFKIAKPAGTRRIFALGGSTTQGQPYRTETAFPQWLQLRLNAADPAVRHEVINCGGISYASYRVAAILDEVLKYSPDLIVLYTGHNEFLEARTYSRQRSVPRWLARPLAAVSTLRVARVMSRWMIDSSSNDASRLTKLPSEVDTLLDHSSGMDAYVRDPDWIEGVHQHFTWTMQQMVDQCAAASVPMVLCVPASDLVNTPPFKSEPSRELSLEDRAEVIRLSNVITSATEKKTAVAAAASILSIDPFYAMALYVIGRDEYDTAKVDSGKAKSNLLLAKDHDVCPLRATTTIENTIRGHGDSRSVWLVDIPAALDRRNNKGLASPDGMADPQWFVDHVHPTIAGHQEIAEQIFTRVRDEGWASENSGASARYADAVQTQLKSLTDAYYGRAKQRLEGVNRWSRRVP